MKFTNHLALTKRLGYIICKTRYINSNEWQQHFKPYSTLSLKHKAQPCNASFSLANFHMCRVCVNCYRCRGPADGRRRISGWNKSTFSVNDAHFSHSLSAWCKNAHSHCVISTYNVLVLICFSFVFFFFVVWNLSLRRRSWFKWKSVNKYCCWEPRAGACHNFFVPMMSAQRKKQH